MSGKTSLSLTRSRIFLIPFVRLDRTVMLQNSICPKNTPINLHRLFNDAGVGYGNNDPLKKAMLDRMSKSKGQSTARFASTCGNR